MNIYHIHIRKTAGTTVLSLLKGLFDKDQICPIRSETELNTKIPLDQRAEYIKKYSLVTGHFYSQAEKLRDTHEFIVFLRDPIKRTISAYNQILADKNDIFRKFIINKTFQESLLVPECAREFRNGQCRQLVRNAGYDYDSISSVERVSIASDFLNDIWFLGIQDVFELSYSILNYKLTKQSSSINAPKINTKNTASGLKDNKLDSDTLKILFEINAEDRALYETALKIFDSRVRDFIINKK
jgi:hypothetical protein